MLHPRRWRFARLLRPWAGACNERLDSGWQSITASPKATLFGIQIVHLSKFPVQPGTRAANIAAKSLPVRNPGRTGCEGQPGRDSG